jgi:hypothetical protein
VDGNHPEVLADIADRLGILHEKFFRVAAEGAARVRERLELLRDERHEGENVRRLQETLRIREEEWSVSLGETEDELRERLDTVERDVEHELVFFERLMAESGPGSWREGTKAISLALVDLTERIHSAISLRLQQTQAVAALLRRAKDLADGGEEATQRARQYLWNASGAIHAAVWVQTRPSSDDQVRLERWLALRGGSPLPLVDQDIWQKSLRPRHRPAPPPPPPPLETSEDWDPGHDPEVVRLEEARAQLVDRLITAGSAAALGTLGSFDELRLLASFLWLPRDSAPLRRLGLRIQPPGAGMARRAVLRGPGFEVELDNYRFTATTATRQAAADQMRAARQAAEELSAIVQEPVVEPVRRPAVAAAATSSALHAMPAAVSAGGTTTPLQDMDELDGAHVTRPLPAIGSATHRPAHDPAPAAGAAGAGMAGSPPARPEATPVTGGRRFWPFSRRGSGETQHARDD